MEKKKLGKLSLNIMEHTFKPVDPETLSKITGGGYVSSFTMGDGTVTNWTFDGIKYSVYSGNDGSTLYLDGVHVGNNTIRGQYSDTACYFNGEIRVGSGWDNFGFDDLMHEYGHYLQEQSYTFKEYWSGAIGSAYDIWKNNGEGHSERSFEKDATALGEEYAKKYLK